MIMLGSCSTLLYFLLFEKYTYRQVVGGSAMVLYKLVFIRLFF